MRKKKLTVALAGNPNSGKTTVFNNLTGTKQRVANWPGVTVEKKEGNLTFQDYDLNIVDLPGVYGLTAYSMDEVIARNYIIDGKPDIKKKCKEDAPMKHNDVDIMIGRLAVPEPNPYEHAFFDGLIDEIRLYNRVLSVEEVETLYSYQPGN